MRKQTANKGNYLYRLIDNYYVFTTEVYLGKNDTEWAECTEEEKSEFEKHNEEMMELNEEQP
jgi:hypothetical protein